MIDVKLVMHEDVDAVPFTLPNVALVAGTSVDHEAKTMEVHMHAPDDAFFDDAKLAALADVLLHTAHALRGVLDERKRITHPVAHKVQ